MRPHYETEQDRENERHVIAHVSTLWKCRSLKLPDRYWLDYALARNGKVCAWAEVKCRTTKYPTAIVSLQKVMFGRLLARETGLPFFLIVAYPDGDWFYLDVTESPFTLDWGGRKRDDQDVEPWCHFPVPRVLKHMEVSYVENNRECQR